MDGTLMSASMMEIGFMVSLNAPTATLANGAYPGTLSIFICFRHRVKTVKLHT